jgi:hypothetical protein
MAEKGIDFVTTLLPLRDKNNSGKFKTYICYEYSINSNVDLLSVNSRGNGS